MTVTQTPPAQQTVLAVGEASALRNRFISTEVARLTLVFPAVWVAEILRIDRSQILDLPFYDLRLAGVIHHNGQIVPLVAAARLLAVEQSALRERLVVVRLDRTAGAIANIGLIVDRAIGSITRQDLPPALFDTSTTVDRMLLMHSGLIPTDLWQPRI
jgi:hypothetical protein